jgi:PKD repeat protein
MHTRPAIDWKHETGPARTGIYTLAGAAAVTNIGGPGSPVSGPQFGGTSSIGGTWYQGDDFPAIYKNTYFHGDYEGQWIRNFVFDTNNKPVAVRNFLTNAGGIVCIATHPADGSLYYVTWTNGIRRVRYTGGGNHSPVATASANKLYGASPLAVQFNGAASSDPDGSALAYRWTFGDGSAASTEANPLHTFTAPAGTPASYPVQLTVTDPSNAIAQASLLISVNNTPPMVAITSPTNGMRYPLTSETTYMLSANVSDAEHGPNQLACEWRTLLHHNNHIHADPVDTNCTTTVELSPIGCDGQTYYYSISLTVTDAAGLASTDEVRLYPDCQEQPAVLTYLGRDGTGAIRWQLAGDPLRTYVIEGSTNLAGWSPVTTAKPVGGLVEIIDPDAGDLRFRFYRAVWLP